MDDFTNHTNIRWNGHTGIVEYGGDQRMVVLFYNKAVHNPEKSRTSGRPIYEEINYVRIHPVGERLNISDRPVVDGDKRRFPVQWAQFQQNKQQIPEGTQVDLLYPEHPSIAATLRANSVHTIEQLAELSASAIENVGMGCQKWVNDAQKFVEASNKGVSVVKFRHELDDRDQKIKLLERQVMELKELVGQLGANNANGNALKQMQELIAGVMARPVYTPQAGFDPQTAMINSTSPAHEEALAKGRKVNRGRTRTRLAG